MSTEYKFNAIESPHAKAILLFLDEMGLDPCTKGKSMKGIFVLEVCCENFYFHLDQYFLQNIKKIYVIDCVR